LCVANPALNTPPPLPPSPPPPSGGGDFDSVSGTKHLLKGTHFWDCNGGSCDAKTLQPWKQAKYVFSAQYAPLDPAAYGGAQYGEKMWVTGAANDDLARLLGPDGACCGRDGQNKGGCGKCMLLRNKGARNADWSVVMMKKNRCPPNSNGCGPGNKHIDIAVPGYDNLKYSTANICGKSGTSMSRSQSAICGTWYKKGSDTTKGCSCSSLPSDTDAQKVIKRGCELFTSWGWTTGNPTLEAKIVPCPKGFENVISGAFGRSGVQPVKVGGGPGAAEAYICPSDRVLVADNTFIDADSGDTTRCGDYEAFILRETSRRQVNRESEREYMLRVRDAEGTASPCCGLH